jgi:hypothetical protein
MHAGRYRRDVRVEAEEYHELDDERVFVLHRASGAQQDERPGDRADPGRGRQSLSLTGGRVTRLVHSWDGASALADLGLAEERDAASPGGRA